MDEHHPTPLETPGVTLGQALEWMRQASGLTLEELARLSDLESSRLALMETTDLTPTAHELSRILEALGGDLLGVGLVMVLLAYAPFTPEHDALSALLAGVLMETEEEAWMLWSIFRSWAPETGRSGANGSLFSGYPEVEG